MQICFCFKKELAVRLLGISGEEIQKLTKKAVRKYSQRHKHAHEYLEVVSRKRGS